MTKRTAPARRQGGFSLIEMMVSMAILALITVYLTDLLVRQSRTYTVVDQVTEVQQNVRAITDLIEREMRTTGFMMDEAGVACAVDFLNRPDILVVTDAAAFDPTDQSVPDMAVDVVDAEYAGVGTDTYNVVSTSTEADPTTGAGGNPFYDLDGNGAMDGDFFDVQPVNAALVYPQGQSGGVIVFDRNNPAIGTACGRIVPGSVGANQLRVDYTFGVPGYAPTPLVPVPSTDLWMVPAVVYQVDQGAGAIAIPPVTSQLLRNGLVIAEDVEDLQLAMWFDADTDGTVDNGEFFGGNPADAQTGGTYPPTGANQPNHRLLREIRVNLLMRTRQQDPNVAATTAQPQGQFPNMENRNTAAPVPDGFVRRIQTLTVRPRNVGLRSDSL